jgi:hypothetical protein
MKIGRTVMLAVVLGIVGLVVGYLIFARRPLLEGWYPVETLLSNPEHMVGETVQDLRGVTAARQNTLISGGVGVILGVVIGLAIPRR